MATFTVRVREERVIDVQVQAEDEDNARFLAAAKIRLMRRHSTAPPSQHVRDLPFFSWDVSEVEPAASRRTAAKQ